MVMFVTVPPTLPPVAPAPPEAAADPEPSPAAPPEPAVAADPGTDAEAHPEPPVAAPEPPSHVALRAPAARAKAVPFSRRHSAPAQRSAALPPAPPVPPAEPARLQAPVTPAAAPVSSAAEASFEGRLLQAVQAEARRSYPAAARLMGTTGEAAIAFEYCDGRVRVTSLLQGSGSPALDRAATAAVQNASYPAPPAELAGRILAKVVHVKFEMAAE